MYLQMLDCETNTYLSSADFHAQEFNISVRSLIEAEWRMCASVNSPQLVQIMPCRLVGAKQLSEPMLKYCWFDPEEQTSVTY